MSADAAAPSTTGIPRLGTPEHEAPYGWTPEEIGLCPECAITSGDSLAWMRYPDGTDRRFPIETLLFCPWCGFRWYFTLRRYR